MPVERLTAEKIAELQTLIELVVDASKHNYQPSAERVADVYEKYLMSILTGEPVIRQVSAEDYEFLDMARKEAREDSSDQY